MKRPLHVSRFLAQGNECIASLKYRRAGLFQDILNTTLPAVLGNVFYFR
jgi:hypothetical protein